MIRWFRDLASALALLAYSVGLLALELLKLVLLAGWAIYCLGLVRFISRLKREIECSRKSAVDA